ncbi:hypothetical protein PG988_005243 [Apiospora saccharicola]
MSRHMSDKSSKYPEFPRPWWVFDPTLLDKNISLYMVDMITDLRNVDRRYKLPKTWLGDGLSPRERAQFIMQHMEHRPWMADTQEESQTLIEAYIKPDFILDNQAQVLHFYELVSSDIPSIHGEYKNSANMELYLEARAFFETVLTLVLVEGAR